MIYTVKCVRTHIVNIVIKDINNLIIEAAAHT